MISHVDLDLLIESKCWLPRLIFQHQEIPLSRRHYGRQPCWSRLQSFVEWQYEYLSCMVYVGGAYFPPRVRTKLFSSCVTRISIARSVTSWTLNPSTFLCNSIIPSFWGTARMYLAGPTTQLKSRPMQINTHQASSRASCEWNPLLLPSSQEICW